jgi:ComF family protein
VGEQALRQVEFAEGCLSPLRYGSGVRRAVHQYKYAKVAAYSVPLGKLVAQCVQDGLPGRADALTWAPLSKQRLRQRGFDQAEQLARRAGEVLSLPVVCALKKVRDTSPQSLLKDAAQRRANVLGAYVVRPDADVSGMRLIVVDDVVTSGATLSECARALRQSGAAKVWCATLAQARRG